LAACPGRGGRLRGSFVVYTVDIRVWEADMRQNRPSFARKLVGKLPAHSFGRARLQAVFVSFRAAFPVVVPYVPVYLLVVIVAVTGT
jgi:hypothetical protein